jgi:hypothetical protein
MKYVNTGLFARNKEPEQIFDANQHYLFRGQVDQKFYF